MDIKVKVETTIIKPTNLVFDSILDPEKINKYFITRSSGPLGEGAKTMWYFDDVGAKLEINTAEIVQNQYISFDWKASSIPANVEISITELTPNKSKIEITESSFPMTEQGIRLAMQQTQGWTDFLCSMKAYLYTGINLRNGKYN